MADEREVERMFTFTTSSQSPVARVRCHACGWTTQGENPGKVFPKADEHACSQIEAGA
jgi:hypothetical protein